MTHTDDASTYADLLARLGDDGSKELFRRLLEGALQGLIDAELTAQIGADRYQRSESRSNHRNGGRSGRCGAPFREIPGPGDRRMSPVGVGSGSMGLLRRLLGNEPKPMPNRGASASEASRPSWMKDGMSVSLFEGDEMLEVKGESFHQGELRQIVRMMGRDVPAILVPEPNNPYDSNAVGVWVAGLQLGHLSREDAPAFQQAVTRLMKEKGQPIALMGRILGGDADRPNLGIWLMHDPTDFGLRSRQAGEKAHEASRHDGGVLTGSSAARLVWMARLPSDRLAAIKYLRALLTSEAEPMERHFIYLELEKLLYKSRDVFESAVNEFEQACQHHDAEMETILPELRAALGGVPALPTYKQVAIMKQKEHDFERALWWAERGLVHYGEDGLCSDHVEDLRNRAERYRGKLGR